MEQDVNRQYEVTDHLDARIELHKRCGTNPTNFRHWVFDQIELEGKRILEVGCGTGELWIYNRDRLPKNCRITLMDCSGAMMERVQALLGEDERFEFLHGNIMDIPYNDNTFDGVITNHMLFHVSDILGALWEVRRVLNKRGINYATTSDQHVLQTFYRLLTNFDDRIDLRTKSPHMRFNRHNGLGILEEVFDDVEMLVYQNELRITEADLLVNYVLSLVGVANITEIIKGERIPEFKKYLEDIIQRDGEIVFPNRTVMFKSI